MFPSPTTGKGDIIWLAADQQDSATWAVNSATRVETIKYNDPYGNPRGASAAPQWPAGQRGFVGGVEDPTGLALLGARYYDPKLGSFLSVDPQIDEYDPQRLHPYAYANNNPVTFSDPDGLFWGAVKNGIQKAATAFAGGVSGVAKAAVENAGTIADIASAVAVVAAVLPPPSQVVAAAAGAVAVVAGAIDTAKSCIDGATASCAMGIAGMVPGVRQAKSAARGAGAVKEAAESAGKRKGTTCFDNSFVPGTKVLMADGSHKPIDEVDIADEVWASDPETGEEGPRSVTDLIAGHGEKRLVDVAVDTDGDQVADASVTATDGHPFWVTEQREWVQAGALLPGMDLLRPDGSRVTVIAIVAWAAVSGAHNLVVDGLHTYFVQFGNSDILVHNCGPTEQDAIMARDRAEELSDQWSGGPYGTVAVIGVYNVKTKKWTNYIAVNRGQKMPKNLVLRDNEKFLRGKRSVVHAEETILSKLGRNHRIGFGGTSRNICKAYCYRQLNVRGMKFGGDRPGRSDKTPFSYFWSAPSNWQKKVM